MSDVKQQAEKILNDLYQTLGITRPERGDHQAQFSHVMQKLNSKPLSQKARFATQFQHHPLTEHIDYKMENGLMVLNEWYLLKRGHCCKNGCRRCPYKNNTSPNR